MNKLKKFLKFYYFRIVWFLNLVWAPAHTFDDGTIYRIPIKNAWAASKSMAEMNML